MLKSTSSFDLIIGLGVKPTQISIFTRRVTLSHHFFFYVDDLLITGNELALISHAKALFITKYKMQDLGPMQQYLGVEFCFTPTDSFSINNTSLGTLLRFSKNPV